MTIPDTDVKYLADMLAFEFDCGFRLSQKPLYDLWLVECCRLQKFDSHELVQMQVACERNDAHTTLAEYSLDSIAAENNGARFDHLCSELYPAYRLHTMD